MCLSIVCYVLCGSVFYRRGDTITRYSLPFITMKLKAKPETLTEHLALAFNLAPLPLVDTQISFNAARAIMAAAETGIFEALGKTQKTTEAIATACNTHPDATRHLLNCLTGMGYVQWRNNGYSLKKKYYKWLLTEYPSNVISKLRFQLIEWNWMAKLETYIRTGVPLNFHEHLSAEEWTLYQQGMRDLSVNAAEELSKKLPVPKNALQMLDIGGSHGLYSVELCKKYPLLKSTILELPGAIDPASAIAAKNGLAERVQYQPGNALTDDLGERQYNLVMMNNLAHHFSAEQNRHLAKKVFRSLIPGGLFIIGEFTRMEKPGAGGVVAATSGLYFAFTSLSGTWRVTDMQNWMQEAGFRLKKEITIITLPGFKAIVGVKESNK